MECIKFDDVNSVLKCYMNTVRYTCLTKSEQKIDNYDIHKVSHNKSYNNMILYDEKKDKDKQIDHEQVQYVCDPETDINFLGNVGNTCFVDSLFMALFSHYNKFVYDNIIKFNVETLKDKSLLQQFHEFVMLMYKNIVHGGGKKRCSVKDYKKYVNLFGDLKNKYTNVNTDYAQLFNEMETGGQADASILFDFMITKIYGTGSNKIKKFEIENKLYNDGTCRQLIENLNYIFLYDNNKLEIPSKINNLEIKNYNKDKINTTYENIECIADIENLKILNTYFEDVKNKKFESNKINQYLDIIFKKLKKTKFFNISKPNKFKTSNITSYVQLIKQIIKNYNLIQSNQNNIPYFYKKNTLLHKIYDADLFYVNQMNHEHNFSYNDIKEYNNKYKIHSILSLEKNHWIAYVQIGDEWYLYDDKENPIWITDKKTKLDKIQSGKLTQTDPNDFNLKNAKMFFYEKI